MSQPIVESMAQDLIRQLSTAKITVEQAMEILTASLLSVATVGGIQGTSTNGKYTLLIQKGSPDELGIDTEQFTDHISQVGGKEPTKH